MRGGMYRVARADVSTARDVDALRAEEAPVVRELVERFFLLLRKALPDPLALLRAAQLVDVILVPRLALLEEHCRFASSPLRLCLRVVLAEDARVLAFGSAAARNAAPRDARPRALALPVAVLRVVVIAAAKALALAESIVRCCIAFMLPTASR